METSKRDTRTWSVCAGIGILPGNNSVLCEPGVLVALVLAGVGIAVALTLRALDENILYFYTPHQVAAGEAP